jgi:hypothetical protein
MNPFSLRIFVADGDPDGLRIVERSNWVGRALVFPRAAWAQPSVADRSELQQTGVYLLLGPREDGEGERLYIGEGDPIKPRLASHHSGTAQKDFWTRAICFVSMGQALNKAHVQFLEANLIRLAKRVQFAMWIKVRPLVSLFEFWANFINHLIFGTQRKQISTNTVRFSVILQPFFA